MYHFCGKDLNLFNEFIRNIKHSKHNKNYIEVLGPPNDHYHQQREASTRRYRCSPTEAGLTLLMTLGKPSCTKAIVLKLSPWNPSIDMNLLTLSL
jgi:hypothetical protein